MTYLALDLGTKTGWSIGSETFDRGRVLAYGEENFGQRSRYEGGGMRYLRFAAWLDRIYSTQPFEQVAFEEVRRHMGVDAAHVYGGLLATLTSWCEAHKMPYQGVPVQHIKKHATGKGNAKKEVMIHAMTSRGHVLTVKQDNAADALALLYWMFENCHATTSPADQRHALHNQSVRRVPLDLMALAAPRAVRGADKDAGLRRRPVRRKRQSPGNSR